MQVNGIEEIVTHSLLYIAAGGLTGCVVVLLGTITGWLFKFVLILLFKDKFKDEINNFKKSYPSFIMKAAYLVNSLIMTIFISFASLDIMLRLGYINTEIPLFWVGFLSGVGAIISLSILVDYRDAIIDWIRGKIVTFVKKFVDKKGGGNGA